MTTAYIDLPFMDRWREAMLGGMKICTCRREPHGKSGDRFQAFGATFELTDVQACRLGDVANHHYADEGVRSPQEYIEVWTKLHRKTGFRPKQRVYLHYFRLVAAA